MLTAEQAYLTEKQYADPSRLEARSRLHRKYGRSDWLAWIADAGQWPSQGACIDVGCGAGAFWRAMAERLPAEMEVCLVDLSAGMVASALEAARSTGRWRSVTGEIADAEALPFADGVFDTALAIHMLYHLPQPERGVAELRRVLKDDGQALVALNGASNMAELSELRRLCFGDDRPMPTPLSLDQAEPILKRYFSRVELLSYPDELVCTEPQDVIDYIASLPAADAAREDQRAALPAIVENAFERGGGTFRVTKTVGLFRCQL